MKKFYVFALALLTLGIAAQSCHKDDPDYSKIQPTALVTVRPAADQSFVMQLDNETVLYPSNMTLSPFKDKEVRALVNFSDQKEIDGKLNVHVNWLDSIRTKKPVPSLEDNSVYGSDPIEIVRDWVTVAEDGYLTLRVRTVFGDPSVKHELNLVTGTNPEDPYELELRHNANKDIYGHYGDALIAFNLNDLPVEDSQTVKIKVKWRSFSGYKSTDFDLYIRPKE